MSEHKVTSYEIDPEMVDREVELNGIDGMRLMCAFQVLGLPSGFYRGTTHTRAREVIEELLQIKLKTSAQPDKPYDLQGYVTWASNPDLQKPFLEPSEWPAEE